MRSGVGILVTNNPLVTDRHGDKYNVVFLDTDIPGVLTHVRDLVHKGHRMMTHPLSGSVKPNETVYKTVLLSAVANKTDTQSVIIIEDCIMTVKKFTPRQIPEQYIYDMQVIDLSLIESALEYN